MQQVYETILQLAHAHVPVLLQGESGVGMVKRYLVLQRIEPVQMEIKAKISRRSVDEVDQIAEQYLQENGDNLDLKEIARRATLKVEHGMIMRALQKSKWNRVEAAKELKVSYKTLLPKIEQLDIRPSMA
ncbi:MAG: helix-turn-helix domain-containing protein [Acidobacteriota bacterium]